MKSALLIGLMILLLFSCKKKYYDHVIENEAVRRAATIDVGSYFVYKDPTALLFGKLDSFGVTYNLNTGFYDYRGAGTDGPYHSYEILEYAMVNDVGDSLSFKAEGYTVPDSGYLKGSFILKEDSLSFSPYYLYLPFNESAVVPVADDGTSASFALKYHASFAIGAEQYFDVYEMMTRQVTAGTTDTQYLHTYYSTQSGLIRYEARNGNGEWKLRELRRTKVLRQ